VLSHIDSSLNPRIEKHPNVSLITFSYNKDVQDFSGLRSALSITDQITSINLSKRDWRVAMVAAGINPSLACVMCELAKVKSGEVILDLFCGAGVIPISAIMYYKAKTAIASDISGSAIDCVYKNALAAKIGKNLIIIRSDIKRLKLGQHSVDKIITNPPFGIRVGSHEDNLSIYNNLFILSERVLKPNGLLVVLTQEINLLQSTASKFPKFTKIKDLELFHGGLRPHIFVYKLLGIKNIATNLS